ncbi:MAG: N-formylglutamate amidohydrolase [Siculibacillus sp.]|nr:N-formylglutamate amidohydrolase [Siculibacillus sp.]
MRIVDGFAVEPPFDLLWPERIAAPVLLASPHSGRDYPRDFLAMTRLDRVTIRRSEDAFVDDLCRTASGGRLPVLAARFPRAWLDVNREPLELDPRMFSGRLPAGANTRSTRVAGGLGTIPRIVTERDEIYGGPIPIEEALDRIAVAYEPYHAVLRRSLTRLHARFGRAVIVDCHSMPSLQRTGGVEGRADIVIGDRHGSSCHPALTDLAATLLREAGYRVALNKPYAGGHVTETCGRPDRGLHALQIEISRGLYLNEATITRTNGFASLSRAFTAFVARFAEGFEAIFDDLRSAAE